MKTGDEIIQWLESVKQTHQYEMAMCNFDKIKTEVSGAELKKALRDSANERFNTKKKDDDDIFCQLWKEYHHDIVSVVKDCWEDLHLLTEAKRNRKVIGMFMHQWIDENMPDDVVVSSTHDMQLEDIFNAEQGGIGGRKDVWLLLLAAEARGKKFESLPAFVDWMFANHPNVSFARLDVYKSLVNKLKGKPWTIVTDQISMHDFINTIDKQAVRRTADIHIADRLFVALKGI